MLRLVAALALFAAPANSQELRAFLQSIDGTEVTTRADIGYTRGSELFLRIDGMRSSIAAEVAINREQLAAIDGCHVMNFDERCTADIQAELNFSDGQIFATIFDIQNVTRGD